MRVKAIVLSAMMCAVATLFFAVSTASACNPGEGLNCRFVRPFITPIVVSSSTISATDRLTTTIPVSPTVTPTPAVTTTTLLSLAVASESSQPLVCLLPDGESPTTPLGISDKCVWTPLPIRAVRASAPPAPTAAPTAVAAKPAAAKVVAPRGDNSPESAMPVTDAWQTIDPGAHHWYRIDNGNNFYLNMWLDSNGQLGVTLAMYSPDQSKNLAVNTPPKGRGAPIKNDSSHDQMWNGAQAAGIWYALVTNTTSVPMQYQIGYKQATMDRSGCIGYWEFLPDGRYVYWTACR